MSLRFLIGTSGTGKTYYCMKEISQQYHETTRQILLVPEQFTSQAERDLTMLMSGKTILRAEVLSFGRLAHQIFSKCGLSHATFLDNVGKQLTLQKILLDEMEHISFFHNMMDKNGFLDQLSLTISEFFQYQIQVEDLEALAKKETLSHNAQQKCKDLAHIYHCYREFLMYDRVGLDETLSKLSEQLEQEQNWEQTEIWFDGFYGFTPQQYSVISQLLRICKRVTITLTMNRATAESDFVPMQAAFYEPYMTMQKLIQLAQQTGTTIEPTVYFEQNYRTKNQALQFLSQYYFQGYTKAYPHTTDGIHVISCNDMPSELQFVTGKILELVRTQKYRFREIAIVTNDLPKYETRLRAILQEQNIPFFIDTRKECDAHPLVSLVKGMLDCVKYDFSYESVCTYLKSGLTLIKQEDVDILENYILAYGIKGYKWKKEQWQYGFSEGQEEQAQHINDLKNTVFAQFAHWLPYKKNELLPMTVWVQKIIKHMDTLQVAQTLTQWAEKQEQSGNIYKATEHRQMWQTLIHLLQSAVDILDNTSMTLQHFSKILLAGISKSTLGIIPPTTDCILVGDLQRTRLPEIRALFVLAVNDGILPSVQQPHGIFTESERDTMTQTGIELAPDNKRKLFEEQFLIYRSLTKPSEELYLSFVRADGTGKPLFPSMLISKVLHMYPTIQIEPASTASYLTFSPVSCFHQLGEQLQNYESQSANFDTRWLDVYQFFATTDEWKERLLVLQEHFVGMPHVEKLSKDITKKLYGKNIISSVSRLERFAACPFSYFVEYGLKAKQRKRYQLRTPDLGILYHEVLEQFGTKLEQEQKSWQTLTQTETEERVEHAITCAVPKLGNEILLDSAAHQYLVHRLKRIAKRATWTLVRHVQSGNFVPTGYELNFGTGQHLPPILIELSDKSHLILRGTIDRVDILDVEGKRFVKIIDYKSGNQTFQWQDIYYGLQLQLLLYLHAYLKESKQNETYPGGIFYFHVTEPTISVENEISAEVVSELLYKKMKLSGLVLLDETVIQALDNAFIDKNTGEFCGTDSDIIPVKYTSKGEISKQGTCTTATAEEYQSILSFALQRAASIGDCMKEGIITPAPYRKQSQTQCQYCTFSSICRYEYDKHPQYRDLKKRSKEDIIQENNSPKTIFE